MSIVKQWLYLKDEEGVPLEDVYLNLYLTGTTTKAILYSDSIGTLLDQETWTTGTSGFFNFYIGNEWSPSGYEATQFFDLSWRTSPFNYLTDGDMEANPTNNWSANNAHLEEELYFINSGTKALKVFDWGTTAVAYQNIETEPGILYSVTGYGYSATASAAIPNIFAGSSPAVNDYGGATITVKDVWTKATFQFTALSSETSINLNCQGVSGSSAVLFDDISVTRVTAQDNSGVIEHIQLFPFFFSVDETDQNEDKNKLLSNQLAYKFEQHVNETYLDEPHEIEPVNVNLTDGKNNKVVSDSLIYEINSLLNILLTCGGDAISVKSAGSLVETVFLDTFTPSANGYYTDLVHSINRSRMYPVIQFYEYLSPGIKGRIPIPGSPSAGSNEIIYPRAIQDISTDTIRVWTTKDTWLMATVVASGE